MLEMIYSVRTYEICYLWSTGSLYSTMIALNDSNAEGIASAFIEVKGAVEASVAYKMECLMGLG